MRSLVETIDEMDNPFQESSEDLLQMSTWGFANEGVVETVRKIARVDRNSIQHLWKNVLFYEKINNFDKPKLNHHYSVVQHKDTLIYKQIITLLSVIYIPAKN